MLRKWIDAPLLKKSFAFRFGMGLLAPLPLMALPSHHPDPLMTGSTRFHSATLPRAETGAENPVVRSEEAMLLTQSPRSRQKDLSSSKNKRQALSIVLMQHQLDYQQADLSRSEVRSDVEKINIKLPELSAIRPTFAPLDPKVYIGLHLVQVWLQRLKTYNEMFAEQEDLICKLCLYPNATVAQPIRETMEKRVKTDRQMMTALIHWTGITLHIESREDRLFACIPSASDEKIEKKNRQSYQDTIIALKKQLLSFLRPEGVPSHLSRLMYEDELPVCQLDAFFKNAGIKPVDWLDQAITTFFQFPLECAERNVRNKADRLEKCLQVYNQTKQRLVEVTAAASAVGGYDERDFTSKLENVMTSFNSVSNSEAELQKAQSVYKATQNIFEAGKECAQLLFNGMLEEQPSNLPTNSILQLLLSENQTRSYHELMDQIIRQREALLNLSQARI